MTEYRRWGRWVLRWCRAMSPGRWVALGLATFGVVVPLPALLFVGDEPDATRWFALAVFTGAAMGGVLALGWWARGGLFARLVMSIGTGAGLSAAPLLWLAAGVEVWAASAGLASRPAMPSPPGWMAAVARATLVCVPVLWGLAAVAVYGRASRVVPFLAWDHCVACGYDLRATRSSGGRRCPECGASYRGRRGDA